ncbi:MAG: AGE family epimerase/isomerase, partial [Eubacteriales bacterium]|nr:AGE family epimerase/isomerase [Eubacteriales bacterium]
MKPSRIKELIGFYENELTNNLLFFWLPRCLDDVHGGYFNCFDNSGKQLLSRDKYTWSQGRFVWLFAKLAMMETQTFTGERKAFFLELARSGRDFLFQHALLAPNDWRCVFLTDEAGQPKLMPGADSHDSSIYADCFVIGAFARYALAAGDKESYVFARKLHESVLARLQSGRFQTHP